jgi:uncharacterized OsmC-like protein
MNQQIAHEANVVIYRSQVTVDLGRGATKMVHLPAEETDVPMGLHGPIAEHYQVPQTAFVPHATTLDYIVGAVTACLTGTLSRALAGKKIRTMGGRLRVEGAGEIESDEGTLVIRRIQIVAFLQCEDAQKGDAEDIIASYALGCPVYRTLYKSIEITSRLEFQATPVSDGL